MANFFIAFGIIFMLLMGWIAVQQMARKFAARHPELGIAREEGSGCGGCGCNNGQCKKNG